jgi:hypothetical protein
MVKLSGYLTLPETGKLFSKEELEALMSASKTTKRIFVKLLDPKTGEEIIISGDLRVSKRGNLTASIKTNLPNYYIEDVDKRKNFEDTAEADELAAALGIKL